MTSRRATCQVATTSNTSVQTFRVLSASAPGYLHVQDQLPCQDKYAYRELQGGVLAVALADGAGSASEAEAGAELAVRVAVETLANLIEEDHALPGHAPLTLALHDAWAAIHARAEQQGVPISVFACTMLVLLATREQVCSLQIGDGAIVIRARDRSLRRLGAAQRGEFVNQAPMLTTPGAIEHAVRARWNGAWSELVALTDGLELLSMTPGSKEPHGPFFHPLLDFAATTVDPDQAKDELRHFLTTPPISEIADDDRALVLAVPLG